MSVAPERLARERVRTARGWATRKREFRLIESIESLLAEREELRRQKTVSGDAERLARERRKVVALERERERLWKLIDAAERAAVDAEERAAAERTRSKELRGQIRQLLAEREEMRQRVEALKTTERITKDRMPYGSPSYSNRRHAECDAKIQAYNDVLDLLAPIDGEETP